MHWGKQRPRSADARHIPLLARSLDDADAFHEFYVEYAQRVMVFFTRRLFDAEAAADLTGETFALAFARRAQWRGTTDEEEQGWLFAIARSQLARYCRRGDVEREALNRMGLDPPDISADEIQYIERLAGLDDLRRDVQRALGLLSEEQAYAVTQRVLNERSYADLAEELAVSQQVIRARVSRGLRSMAGALDPSDIQEVA